MIYQQKADFQATLNLTYMFPLAPKADFQATLNLTYMFPLAPCASPFPTCWVS